MVKIPIFFCLKYWNLESLDINDLISLSELSELPSFIMIASQLVYV
jgi:hypothetical protein